MANTITNVKQINGQNVRVLYLTLASDGTNESNTVIYDSSAYAGTDPLTSRIMRVWASVSTASTARVVLRWDATTPVLALSLLPGQILETCFQKVGGLNNMGGAGKTGDITLTTTGLASGDSITIILEIRAD